MNSKKCIYKIAGRSRIQSLASDVSSVYLECIKDNMKNPGYNNKEHLYTILDSLKISEILKNYNINPNTLYFIFNHNPIPKNINKEKLENKIWPVVGGSYTNTGMSDIFSFFKLNTNNQTEHIITITMHGNTEDILNKNNFNIIKLQLLSTITHELQHYYQYSNKQHLFQKENIEDYFGEGAEASAEETIKRKLKYLSNPLEIDAFAIQTYINSKKKRIPYTVELNKLKEKHTRIYEYEIKKLSYFLGFKDTNTEPQFKAYMEKANEIYVELKKIILKEIRIFIYNVEKTINKKYPNSLKYKENILS